MTSPSKPSAGPSAGEAPLVGRTRELAQLLDAFEAARERRGGVHLILGDPGVGKTRLAAALAEHAAAHGATVVCTRGLGRAAPAYWPWVEVVRSLCEKIDGAWLRRELDWAADELLRLAPELAGQLAASQPPADRILGAESSELARFALFDALVALLRVRSSDAPLVMLIDDLQAADEGSLVALRFVSRMLPYSGVLVVGTMHERVAGRSPEQQTALADIAGVSRRLVLGGLSPQEMAELIAAASGTEPSERLVGTVHGVTEGNPLFAREIVALLLAEGRLEDPPEELPLPAGVRETIRRRLEPLAAPAVETLELAAILGRTFALPALEHASLPGLDRDCVLSAIEQAAQLGLVVELPAMLGRYRFGHGLIRETLLASMPASARMAAHQAAGEALEDFYRGAPDSHLPELAHHFLQAAPRGDPAKAVDYAERAARNALDNLGYEQAAELFARGLEALGLVEPDAQRRAQLLLGLAEAQSRAGRQAARATYEAAASLARAIGDAELFARAALGIAPFALTPGFVDEGHVELLVEALRRVPTADDPLRVRLLGSLAVALYWSDAAPRRSELVGEALAMAQRLGDDLTLAFAACSAQLATGGPDSTRQGLRWLQTLFALTPGGAESTMTLAARSRHIDMLLELDDIPAADMAIERLGRAASDARDPRAAALVPLHRARRAALADRFGEAHALVDGVAAISDQLKGSTIPMTVASQRLALAWIQRGPRAIGEQVRAWAEDVPAMPVWRAALAAALADQGRVAEARLEFDRLATDGFGGLPRDNLWFVAMALLAEAAGPLGDRARARELHSLLAPFSGRNVVLPTAAFLGPVDMWLGVLARLAGDREEAMRGLAAARGAATRQRARTALARIAVEEATILAEDRAARARQRAGRLLDEAGARCDELELPWLAARVQELRERLRSAGPAKPAADRAMPAGEDPGPLAATGGGLASPAEATLQRFGDMWTITYEQRTLHLRDSRGVCLLALLLERPATEVHCLDLVAALDGGAAAAVKLDSHARQIAGRAGLQGGLGPALDAQAKSEYRARIDVLGEEVAEARAAGDARRLQRTSEELEFVSRELSRALGIGGRDRHSGSNAERARVNVTRSIRLTLKRVAGYDAKLGGVLDATVRTGTFCAYRPDPQRPLRWHVQDRGARPGR